MKLKWRQSLRNQLITINFVAELILNNDYMKKLFILITFLAAFSTTSNAELMSEDEGYEVFLKTEKVRNNIGGNDYPRAPIRKPKVTISNNTLYVSGIGGGYSLYVESNSEVIYSCPISAGGGSFLLPISDIQEPLTIKIVSDRFCFTGIINL